MATKQTKVQTPAVPPPADTYDWGSYSGATGFETTAQDDFGIPYLSICQKGSAEFDKTHKQHSIKAIPDIEPGDIFDTKSRRYLDKPVKFVPAHYIKLYQEWRPRGSGGGFVKSHISPTILTQCERNSKNEDVLENGNVIITTSYFYGFYSIEDGDSVEWRKVILPMVSTQLKKARSWLNMMDNQKLNGKRLPMFSTVYHLSTIIEQNEDGSWYGWKVDVGNRLTNTDGELVKLCIGASQELSSTKMLAEASETAE